MAQDRNEEDRLGGEFMIQDRDHMGETGQVGGKSRHGGGRQSEQSHSEGRQQGGGQHGGNTQQGGESKRKRK